MAVVFAIAEPFGLLAAIPLELLPVGLVPVPLLSHLEATGRLHLSSKSVMVLCLSPFNARNVVVRSLRPTRSLANGPAVNAAAPS